MTTRILVTGAQGFLGRHLAARLLGADSETRVLGIGRSPGSKHLHPFRALGIRPCSGATPGGREGIARVAAVRVRLARHRRQSELTGLLGEFRPHRIFHLASGLRDDAPDHLFRTNVEGTIHLIEGIVEAGLER